MKKITFFWMRRDLRLEDNAALYYACQNEKHVLPIFIFDSDILDDLEDQQDPRVNFIHQRLADIKEELEELGSSLLVKHGRPLEIFKELLQGHDVQAIYTNRDYEPYALERDEKVSDFLKEKNIPFMDFKDQVIFEKDEIMTESENFYKVYTPYRKAWMAKLKDITLNTLDFNPKNLYSTSPLPFPGLDEIGFTASKIKIPPLKVDEGLIKKYHQTRDYPALDATSHLGIHLRFGTISIRKLVRQVIPLSETFLGELIWREFFMMILYHHPEVVNQAFKPAYDRIPWRNDEREFEKWCQGMTGYPMVDAGMRQLNQTGYMHNRVRMVTASFLTKHLLIDWRWGEAYFAKTLLDYELSSNNGNWQWAAGTGTDAQPYFRIFNPEIQIEKFDKDKKYIKKWVPEYGTDQYPEPIVAHKTARERALATYKSALKK